ncbi:MBL fold metallo-hydrolase [Georgenia subflava]|uniref:MBL fold metallo-hydrolase n=1 Tax=Georgenia subflava TaxID=1622177 RepID=A0A6N7EGE4_9MICO|nr:MBL fold metallo-hydrolase [Georgenia subflava]MPV35725.1 MBL fold metallo-hydrolase [Georgenia subflava]
MIAEQLNPDLFLLTLGGWPAYLWRDPDGVTLVDAGPVGSGADLLRALDEIGVERSDVRRLVLTHFHDDHAGGAAEVAGWGGVEIIAHESDAPIIRGDRPGPPPSFSDAERALHARVAGDLEPAPACRVDTVVRDGDVLDIAGGATVVSTPGHTDGSVALYLDRPRVLFTGDTVAEHDGVIMRGVFNLDGEAAAESFRALTALPAEIACFGHGRPVLGDAQAILTTAAAAMITV